MCCSDVHAVTYHARELSTTGISTGTVLWYFLGASLILLYCMERLDVCALSMLHCLIMELAVCIMVWVVMHARSCVSQVGGNRCVTEWYDIEWYDTDVNVCLGWWAQMILAHGAMRCGAWLKIVVATAFVGGTWLDVW